MMNHTLSSFCASAHKMKTMFLFPHVRNIRTPVASYTHKSHTNISILLFLPTVLLIASFDLLMTLSTSAIQSCWRHSEKTPPTYLIPTSTAATSSDTASPSTKSRPQLASTNHPSVSKETPIITYRKEGDDRTSLQKRTRPHLPSCKTSANNSRRTVYYSPIYHHNILIEHDTYDSHYDTIAKCTLTNSPVTPNTAVNPQARSLPPD
jgi:hypothetical protein